MNKAAFHSAGRLDIDMFVNRFRVQRFVFLAASLPFDITAFTWQLLIKTNPGDLKNIISLTLGNGLSFPIYEENVIEARFESATTKIGEGDYYWQLLRTDTNEPWLNGVAKFSYGSLDSGGTSQDATVNVLDNTITVSLQSIVNVSGGVESNTPVVLTDAATINIASAVNTLSSSSATRTFTISYTGDVTEIEVTLSATAATYTFPATALCLNSDGTASGTNTATLAGVSGDKYLIMTSKIGSAYYVIVKNFGQ